MMEADEETAFHVGEETFLDLVYNPSERYMKVLDKLMFFHNREIPFDGFHYHFDIISVKRPAKFRKQQIFNVLKEIICQIDVSHEYFYWFLAKYTNLGTPASIKRNILR